MQSKAMNQLERLPTRSIPVLGFAILALAPEASAAERWVEVRSPNFVVVSNASEGTARHCAWQFEQMRAALAKLWPWARFGRANDVLIAAAKNEASLKKLVPESWEKEDGIRPVSVWVDGRDRHYLMLRSDETVRDDISVNPYFNAFRAYVHVVLDASLERPLPLWLGEALSEYYWNLAVRDKDLVVGRVIPWHVEEIKRGERLRLNQAAEADPLARKAVTLEPGNTYHRVALARVRWSLGRRAEALAEAQRGLSLSKNDNDRANAQNMLDFLQR